jgi:hypothetical protein
MVFHFLKFKCLTQIIMDKIYLIYLTYVGWIFKNPMIRNQVNPN